MRIHEQRQQLLLDGVDSGDAVVHIKRDGSLSSSSLPIVIVMCERPLQQETAAATTAVVAATATSRGSARWRQLRRLMRQLTRGMRTHPALPPSPPPLSSSLSGSECGNDSSDALLSQVAPGVAMLHKDFWLEALDAQHRYGFHLRAFHRVWKDAMASSAGSAAATAVAPLTSDPRDASFFHWLDHGAGRALELPECSRHALDSLRVEYCDARARRAYEVQFVPASSLSATTDTQDAASASPNPSPTTASTVAVYASTRKLVQTDERSKWIFVLALDATLYVGRKRKGAFHHSSFVAGAPILAAGKLMVKHGRIVALEPHSGHFKPTLRNLAALCCVLRAAHVDVARITFVPPKKWTSVWPFADRLPPRLTGCELEDLESDTDYCSYKSDSDES